MLRVIRLEGRRVPRFLVQSATIRGRIRLERLRGIDEVQVYGPDNDVYTIGYRYHESFAASFLGGTFEFAVDGMPQRRGTGGVRQLWAETLESLRLDWEVITDEMDRFAGADLEDHIPELAAADLDAYRSWIYPIEVFHTEGMSWWSVGVAGIDEEMLIFSGGDMQFNRHSEGWQIPGIGATKGRKTTKPYPFSDTRVKQVFTWRLNREAPYPVENETMLKYIEAPDHGKH